MRRVFADTSFYIAAVNPNDAKHSVALAAADVCEARLLTTEYVLVELDNYFCSSNRSFFIELSCIIQNDERTGAMSASASLFNEGVTLYAARPDQKWSLTDCISFVVMDTCGIHEALSSDHHFQQAGYRTLLS